MNGGDWLILPGTLFVILVAAVTIYLSFNLAPDFYYCAIVLCMSAAGGLFQFTERRIVSFTAMPLVIAPGFIYFLTQREIFVFPFLAAIITTIVLGYLPALRKNCNGSLSHNGHWMIFSFFLLAGILPLAAFPLTYGVGSITLGECPLIPAFFLGGLLVRYPRRVSDWDLGGVISAVVLVLLSEVFLQYQFIELGVFCITAFIVSSYLRMLFASDIIPQPS